MNELQIFKNEEFGEVRVIEIEGKTWFIGKDVAVALGYSNASKAVSTHCKHTRKEMIAHSQNGNMVKTQTTLIDEGDLYRLIMKSKLPSAEKFESWVMDEVLPQIRQTVKALENTTFQGNIDGLVVSKDGVPITTSRVISEVTGKGHDHILRDIREEIDKLKEIYSPKMGNEETHSTNLRSEIQLIIDDFKETTYIAENGQTYTQYELGEMATMQLMLKYSTEYRAKFIMAFQKMKTAMLNMFKAKV